MPIYAPMRIAVKSAEVVGVYHGDRARFTPTHLTTTANASLKRTQHDFVMGRCR